MEQFHRGVEERLTNGFLLSFTGVSGGWKMQRAEKKVDRSSVFPLGVLRVVCQYLSQYSSLKALGGATFFSFEKVAAKKGSNAALSRVPKKC